MENIKLMFPPRELQIFFNREKKDALNWTITRLCVKLVTTEHYLLIYFWLRVFLTDLCFKTIFKSIWTFIITKYTERKLILLSNSKPFSYCYYRNTFSSITIPTHFMIALCLKHYINRFIWISMEKRHRLLKTGIMSI